MGEYLEKKGKGKKMRKNPTHQNAAKIKKVQRNFFCALSLVNNEL